MATPPRSGAIAIPFLLAGLTFGLFSFALFSCGGEGAGPGDVRSWGAATVLDNSSAGQSLPEVAVDGNGNAVVAWIQPNDNGIYHVWATRYVSGQGWGTPVQIETEETDTHGCQVVMDPNGNAIVAWVQMDFHHGSNVWTALYRVGTGWDPPSRIGNDNAITADNPRIVMDGNGNALAVWEQTELLGSIFTRRLWSNRYTRVAGWGTPELVGPETGGSFTPDVAVDPVGNGIVIWAQQESPDNVGTGGRIWANRYDASRGWEIPTPIEGTFAMNVRGADVAMDAQGNAMAIWEANDYLTPSRIGSNRYEYGKGWGAGELILSDNTLMNSNPVVSMDPSGNAIVVWVSLNNAVAPESLWANRYGIRSGWGSPQSIGGSGVMDPQLGMDASGNGIVAWTQTEFPSETAKATRFVPGTGWGTPAKIGSADVFQMRWIRLAVSARGDALAVWEQLEPPGVTRIRAAWYGASPR